MWALTNLNGTTTLQFIWSAIMEWLNNYEIILPLDSTINLQADGSHSNWLRF